MNLKKSLISRIKENIEESRYEHDQGEIKDVFDVLANNEIEDDIEFTLILRLINDDEQLVNDIADVREEFEKEKVCLKIDADAFDE